MRNPLICCLFLFCLACTNDDDDQQAIDNRFLGEYQVVAIQESASVIKDQPEDQTPIGIQFFEQETYEGQTSKNTFKGSYYTESDNNLIVETMGTTEVLDTEWGQLFYDSFRKAYDINSKNYTLPYQFMNDTLQLKYGASQFLFLKKL